MVLDPSEAANHQAANHCWKSHQLDRQLGQKPRKRSVPRNDGIVEGITGEPHALARRPNGGIGAHALETAGGEAADMVILAGERGGDALGAAV